MEESLFAYSLCQSEQGWLWRLWDETGDVVAAGAAPDQVSAHRRLLEAFERTRSAAAADRKDPRHDASQEAGRKPRAGLASRRRPRAPAACDAQPAYPRASARP